jgi:hypothetical protein
MTRAQSNWAKGLAVTALVLAAAPAWAKTARCEIKTTDANYAGPCRFSGGEGGSFGISPVGRAEFFAHEKDEPGVTDISVDIEGGVADVRGLTTFGINSRWGAAKRSKTDRACWVGEDFSICVY